MSESWFVRFTVKSKEHKVEMFTILSGNSASTALEALIQEQMKRHEIARSDVDILIMNKV